METNAIEITLSERLKQCQLLMLKEYIHVCRELGLRYFVFGGTLLGAVRHHGFIPWDDDIDVAMPRTDYERFLEKGQALLSGRYFLQTFRTDPEFPANFAKIRDSQTTFIERSISSKRVHHGAYIDIFPLDFYPDGFFPRTKLELQRFFMKMRISNEFLYPEDDPLPKAILRRLLGQFSRLLYTDSTQTLEKREKLHTSVPEGTRMCNYSCARCWTGSFPAEWISESCELLFEDITVTAPARYHELLCHFYGDYMTLPPPEKRVGHHMATTIDLERPYTYYLKNQ